MADKYISAEALTLSLRDDYELNAASFARVKRHIEAAPDMVKRGHWVKKVTPIGLFVKYHCSLCDRAENCNKNFCPNCGAKMDGGNEDV